MVVYKPVPRWLHTKWRVTRWLLCPVGRHIDWYDDCGGRFCARPGCHWYWHPFHTKEHWWDEEARRRRQDEEEQVRKDTERLRAAENRRAFFQRESQIPDPWRS